MVAPAVTQGTHASCRVTSGGGIARRAIRSRIAANKWRVTATSVGWIVAYFACRALLVALRFALLDWQSMAAEIRALANKRAGDETLKSKHWILVGALAGGLAVAMGAFGAHALKDRLHDIPRAATSASASAEPLRSTTITAAELLAIFETGVATRCIMRSRWCWLGCWPRVFGPSRTNRRLGLPGRNRAILRLALCAGALGQSTAGNDHSLGRHGLYRRLAGVGLCRGKARIGVVRRPASGKREPPGTTGKLALAARRSSDRHSTRRQATANSSNC